MYRTRTLPPDEWPKLEGTELELAWPHLDPTGAEVVVVEDDAGLIVGCWALVPYVHAEGVWVHPDHRRRGVVAGRLIQGLFRTARNAGARAVLTSAITPDVEALLVDHLHAVRLPGQSFVFGVGG